VCAESFERISQATVDALRRILGPEALQPKAPLARYTAFRIGGPADLLAVVHNAVSLRQVVALAWDQELPCRVLGGGSNILVSDAGVRGLVVLNRARNVVFIPRTGGEAGGKSAAHPAAGRTTTPEWIARAESGASFSTLARQCVARGLAGLEWAAGIPGTVGGAVVGNAGAWGGDVASSLRAAAILNPDGTQTTWPVDRFQYGYRTSTLKEKATAAERFPAGSHGRRPVVLEADFGLGTGDRQALRARVAEITARRRASQPPGATCGSLFKNPPGDSAGRLIEAAGLKGRRLGDAEISEVHANFIVNLGQAQAADVEALIDLARNTVQARFGISLQLEIELVGDWEKR